MGFSITPVKTAAFLVSACFTGVYTGKCPHWSVALRVSRFSAISNAVQADTLCIVDDFHDVCGDFVLVSLAESTPIFGKNAFCCLRRAQQPVKAIVPKEAKVVGVAFLLLLLTSLALLYFAIVTLVLSVSCTVTTAVVPFFSIATIPCAVISSVASTILWSLCALCYACVFGLSGCTVAALLPPRESKRK
jgi:hypothetical protein